MIVHLLGPPSIRDANGDPVNVRGKKTWGLIARILLSDAPVPRRRVAEELFSTAEDPMGALRWALAQLRRSLGAAESFRNDPIEANLSADLIIDVLNLGQIRINPLDVPGQLLEGIDVAWSPEFEVWLSVERWRAEGQIQGALRTATMQALSAGDGKQAVSLARDLVARAPFEESGHILLVKALVACGEREAAKRRVKACEDLFQAELGIQPSAAVTAALRTEPSGRPRGVSHKASAQSLLEAGTNAVDAGAIDAGIECLRRAVEDAEASNDGQLFAKTQCALGSALIHGIRGFDEEGSLALHSAIESAMAVSDPAIAASALMELGYVELLGGRRNEAATFLDQAMDAAADLPELQSGINSFIAINLTDWGRYEAALEASAISMELAERYDSARDRSWALNFRARIFIALGQLERARELLGQALTLATEERWLTFKPLIELYLLELDRLDNRNVLDIRSDLERVFADCCQLADPCWEGLAARGIGLTYIGENEAETAYGWLGEAVTRCTRVTDTWMWVEAWVLQAEVELANGHGHDAHARKQGERLLHHAATKQLDYHSDWARTFLSQA